MSKSKEWVDEGVTNPGKLGVLAYKDATERSVIFRIGATGGEPALRAHQVRELIAWLNKWLAENE